MPPAIQALILCSVLAAAARADAVAYGDAQGAALKAPEGVACTAEGRVVVADTGNRRLVSFALKDGALVPGAVFAFPELGTPSRVQIDSRGNVIALDARTRRLVRVSDRGGFGGFVAPRDLPAIGWFPSSFKIGPRDELYVVNPGGIAVLDARGRYLRELPGRASDVAVAEQGVVYAVDGRTAGVFADGRNIAKDVGVFPASIAVAGKGQLAIGDAHGHAIVLLAADGTVFGKRSGMGWSQGLVYYPHQLCADGRGDLFVADTGNHRVQVFTSR